MRWRMQALQATAQRYSAEEVALRAVPALAPLSVDPVALVRHSRTPVTLHDPRGLAACGECPPCTIVA